MSKSPTLGKLGGICLAFSLLSAVDLAADPKEGPPWWFEPVEDPVVRPDLPEQNKAVAVIGQAKLMVSRALEQLDEVAPAIAQQIRQDLETVHGEEFLDAPQNAEQRATNRAPLLIGQLKSLAAPFFHRLHENDPEWLEVEMLRAEVPRLAGGYLPWTADPGDDENRGVATIGQLKCCFGLDYAVDADQNDIPDLAEEEGGEVMDSDGDGLSDSDEALHGTDPFDPDTDGDGMPDGWEVAYGFDPNVVESSGRHPDGDLDQDGWSNLSEAQGGTNPGTKDHPSVALEVFVE